MEAIVFIITLISHCLTTLTLVGTELGPYILYCCNCMCTEKLVCLRPVIFCLAFGMGKVEAGGSVSACVPVVFKKCQVKQELSIFRVKLRYT